MLTIQIHLKTGTVIEFQTVEPEPQAAIRKCITEFAYMKAAEGEMICFALLKYEDITAIVVKGKFS